MTDDEIKRQVSAVIARDVKVPALEKRIAELTAELARAKAHIEALQAKDAGGCGCAHDSPDDVCQHHAQRELSAGEHTK